ncbi:MAG: hypothetical protein ACR2IS_12310 [Nitrososphaeraceae archaeon]
MTYLGTIDLEKEGSNRAYVDVKTVTKHIPPEVFPEVETQENIMETMRDMEKRNLIAEWATARYIDEYTFIITSTGLLQFRKQVQPVLIAVAKQNDFEKLIEKTGAPAVKAGVKRMWTKFQDKTEDEIIQMVVKTGLSFGTKIGTVFLVNLFSGGNSRWRKLKLLLASNAGNHTRPTHRTAALRLHILLHVNNKVPTKIIT